jgi:hypothetical protein
MIFVTGSGFVNCFWGTLSFAKEINYVADEEI